MLTFMGTSGKRDWGRGVEGHAKDMLEAAGQDVTLVLCDSVPSLLSWEFLNSVILRFSLLLRCQREPGGGGACL